MAYTREIELLRRRWEQEPGGTDFAPLAELLRKDGQFGAALEVLRVGLSRNPRCTPACIVLGRCYRDQKQYAEAEKAYRAALSLEPGHAIALQELAELSQRTASADQHTIPR